MLKDFQILKNLKDSLEIFEGRFKDLQILKNLRDSLGIFENRSEDFQIIGNLRKTLRKISKDSNLWESLRILENL